MFPPTMHAQGAVTQGTAVKVPDKGKWAHMLPEMELQIADKLGAGWDVGYLVKLSTRQGKTE